MSAHSQMVFGLPVVRSSAWIFNCYVVDTGDRLVVLDPGLPLVADRAVTAIEQEFDRSASDVAAIVCTHAHPDHVGGVATLLDRTDAAVHLPGRCESYLGGEPPRTFPLVESTMRFLPMWAEQRLSVRALAQFARAGTSVGFGGPPRLTLDFEATGFLGDGTELPGASGWETIEAPGHTDDSTCWYHADSETLLSGDAVVTHDGRAWFNPEYVDLAASTDTEERLRSLSVRHLLPGHGKPIEATDVWSDARSSTTPPSGRGLLARCSRRFGRW